MTPTACPPPEGGSSSGRATVPAGLALLTSLFLAACGGDSDTPAPPPAPAAATQVPASAATSDLALETFAFNLAQTDDTEPLTLELVPTLPTSETEDPIATP
jgi:hypothetical protein